MVWAFVLGIFGLGIFWASISVLGFCLQYLGSGCLVCVEIQMLGGSGDGENISRYFSCGSTILDILVWIFGFGYLFSDIWVWIFVFGISR